MKLYFKEMTPAQNVYKIYAKYIEKVIILFFIVTFGCYKNTKMGFSSHSFIYYFSNILFDV